MAKDNRFITSWIWPLLVLIASVAAIIFRHPSTASIIVGALVYVAFLIWLIVNVIRDSDNQFWPSALTAVGFLIVAANLF